MDSPHIAAGHWSPQLQGFKRFTRAFNGRLLYSCTLIALSQLNFGMDQGAFTGTQAMNQFAAKFGVYNPTTKTYALESYFLSLLNSLTYIGFAFGLVFGSSISGRWGRRICMFSMCMWAFVGAIILMTAQSRAQMIVGRVVAYVYIGMELSLVPVLQSELVPAEVRGFVVGTYQSGLLFGQLIQALICRATSELEGERSWRIPLGLFFIVPAILAVGVWFMPESPRWLVIRKRHEEALENLRKLRQGRFSEEQIQQEFKEIQTTVDLTVERGRFVEIFQSSNLKRTLIVVGVNVFLQLTGSNFTAVYGTIFIKSLGVINPFTMTSINTAVAILMVLATQLLTDFTGRVPLLVAGALVQTGSLFTMGGLGTQTPTLPIKQGIVAMVTVFGIGFGLGWAPLSHVVAAEIPTTRLRDQTYAFGAVFNIVIQFAVAFSIPYLIDSPSYLGSKVGFIFGVTATFAVLFSYFCVPECSGKTLEEIDELFLEGVPIRKFGKTKPRMPLVDEEGKVAKEKAGPVHVETTV